MRERPAGQWARFGGGTCLQLKLKDLQRLAAWHRNKKGPCAEMRMGLRIDEKERDRFQACNWLMVLAIWLPRDVLRATSCSTEAMPLITVECLRLNLRPMSTRDRSVCLRAR